MREMTSVTSVSHGARRGRGGRALWRACGIVVCAALGVSALTVARHHWTAQVPERLVTVTATLTVTRPVTGLSVRLPAALVRVVARPGSRVQVTSTLTYDPKWGNRAALTQSVAHGYLTLTCPGDDCGDQVTVTVPPGTAVSVLAQDMSAADVSVAGVRGPVTAVTDGGSLDVSGLSGPLYADTGGGTLTARGIGSESVVASTGGGEARIAFVTPPRTVIVFSGGGLTSLAVPGGPYALNADLSAADHRVGIVTSPDAPRSLTVSGGGEVQVEPAR